MSLRLRAVLITCVSLALLWGSAVAWMMRGVQDNLDRALDGRLAMSARMVSGLLERAALAPDTPSGMAINDVIRVQGSEGIACEIRTLQGDVLARTTSGPAGIFQKPITGYHSIEVQGQSWRVYVLQARGHQITTADRVDQRHALTREFLCAAGVPFLIAFLGGLVALWIGIGRGLAPLDALRRELKVRHADDTQPIAVAQSPRELRPVLDAMNGLLQRLAQTLASQRAFTDAAAHELRTPLTVIDTHLQVLRLSDGPQAETSLKCAEEGVSRLRRTLDQMMILARAEAPMAQEGGSGSLLETIGLVLDRLGEDSRQRVILKQEGPEAATVIPRSMVETIARNLIDNALRYSPEKSQVEICLSFDNERQNCLLSVADRGPGLSAEQAAHIGRRFWRGDQGRRRSDGAGLGISIVRAIAGRFGADLELKSRKGGGLIAELRLPVYSIAI